MKVIYPSLEHTASKLPSADHAASLIHARCSPPKRAIGYECCVSYTMIADIVTTAKIIRYFPLINATAEVEAEVEAEVDDDAVVLAVAAVVALIEEEVEEDPLSLVIL
jgi:hypothetical protein